MGEILNQGYCVTLDNYYTSPEIATALISQEIDCYGTLKKKAGLPPDFWNWKLKKGDGATKSFNGDILVFRWNDNTMTKKEKVVSMLSTVHLSDLVD